MSPSERGAGLGWAGGEAVRRRRPPPGPQRAAAPGGHGQAQAGCAGGRRPLGADGQGRGGGAAAALLLLLPSRRWLAPGAAAAMRQSLTQPRASAVPLPDSAAWFWVISWNNWIKPDRKQKTNGWLVCELENLGLRHCRMSQLVASIVFISFGVIAAFCCAIVDGVFAARHIDLRPLYAGRCQYYSKSTTPPEGICNPQHRGPCTPKIKTNTCFCCDLYNCGNRVEISGGYYEYIDVSSCQDIIHLYHLLWSATILNIVGLFLGIITAAILGGFKDMTPSLPTLNCTVENAHPSVSYYSRPQVTSYNTYYHSTPHLPPYSAYDFQHSSMFPASTPSGLSDDPPSMSPSPSYMWSSNAPPHYSPPYFPPFEKPPPYTP
ncbi:transmembrane protein 255A isoform X3 [Emydura macquarii macquarii]|uniref:transmembrane protein 255A isoform X3 n=1 Tax=Emydura macquarii macquarii TaxID=1129001 RepID=UPI00352A4CCB